MLSGGFDRCGIKASREADDLAIIVSECECTAAATYTLNRVKAAPVYVTMPDLQYGRRDRRNGNANPRTCMRQMRSGGPVQAGSIGIEDRGGWSLLA